MMENINSKFMFVVKIFVIIINICFICCSFFLDIYMLKIMLWFSEICLRIIIYWVFFI